MTNIEQALDYQPEANTLQDKIILVTGAGAGIGRSAALAFAQHGATVILVGRTLSKLEHVYDEIEASGGAKPAIIPLNLEGAAEHDYDELHNILNEEFGRLDGLLHNASELGPRTPLDNYALVEWQKVMHVNVTSAFVLTQKLLPLLNQANAASVVFTGSSVGLKARAYWGAYAVSKAATESLMQLFADEHEHTNKIRFNSINPGATRTTMRATAYPAEDPATITASEDIMNRYIFLMANDSHGITGQQLNAQPQ